MGARSGIKHRLNKRKKLFVGVLVLFIISLLLFVYWYSGYIAYMERKKYHWILPKTMGGTIEIKPRPYIQLDKLESTVFVERENMTENFEVLINAGNYTSDSTYGLYILTTKILYDYYPDESICFIIPSTTFFEQKNNLEYIPKYLNLTIRIYYLLKNNTTEVCDIGGMFGTNSVTFYYIRSGEIYYFKYGCRYDSGINYLCAYNLDLKQPFIYGFYSRWYGTNYISSEPYDFENMSYLIIINTELCYGKHGIFGWYDLHTLSTSCAIYLISKGGEKI